MGFENFDYKNNPTITVDNKVYKNCFIEHLDIVGKTIIFTCKDENTNIACNYNSLLIECRNR